MSKLMPYLRLLRLPTVFTAMADIFLGFAITHGNFEPRRDFVLLLVSSSCLYLAGMVFNDIFDRQADAEARANRPIPAGEITLFSALRIGILLLAAGIGAAQVVGMPSLLIAAILTVCIFLYDGTLKQTPLAPVLMGSCRFLNVMLGASAGETLWGLPQVPVALGMGVYIIGVTWFARSEATTSSRSQLLGAMGVINFGLTIQLGLVLQANQLPTTSGLALIGIILLTVNRRLVAAVAHPVPEVVQPAIKSLLLTLIMLDASLVFIFTGQSGLALATAALLVPAILLSRAIPMT